MGSPYSMTLRRDKRSGSWRDRIRLPEDVTREYRAQFGGPAWEEKSHRPADTPRDKAVADHATWAAKIKGRTATIRASRVGKGIDLTERHAAAVAGDWYRWFVDQHSENPGRVIGPNRCGRTRCSTLRTRKRERGRSMPGRSASASSLSILSRVACIPAEHWASQLDP
jgi:hypothetical protein